MDEIASVSKKIKSRDSQTASVILDFKELRVVQAQMNGQVIPKDWDRVMTYYYQHYKNIIERLFRENGYEIRVEQPAPQAATTNDKESVPDQ